MSIFHCYDCFSENSVTQPYCVVRRGLYAIFYSYFNFHFEFLFQSFEQVVIHKTLCNSVSSSVTAIMLELPVCLLCAHTQLSLKAYFKPVVWRVIGCILWFLVAQYHKEQCSQEQKKKKRQKVLVIFVKEELFLSFQFQATLSWRHYATDQVARLRAWILALSKMP